MTLTLHQPVEGKEPGDTVTVDAARRDFLLAEGYATDGENPPDAHRSGPPYQDAASGDTTEAPATSAPKAEWIDYAVSQGMDRDAAESQTKAELVDQFG